MGKKIKQNKTKNQKTKEKNKQTKETQIRHFAAVYFIKSVPMDIFEKNVPLLVMTY